LSVFSISRDVTLTLAIVLAATPARALDPERRLSQYLRDEWGPSKGYSGGPVYGFAQTPDGYLWIASESGLIRFDGVSFEPLPLPEFATIGGATVMGAATADDGALWMRMRGRALLAYRGGVFDDVMATHRQPAGTIFAMARQAGGAILLAGYSNGVLRFERNQLTAVVAPEMMPKNTPVTSIVDTDGSLYLGTQDQGIFRFNGKTLEHLDGLLPDDKVNCLVADGTGGLWIGTDRGIARWTPAGMVHIELPPGLRDAPILSLLRDHESNVWAAVGAHGVVRINRSGVETQPDWDARKNGSVTALFEDRERNLWIGTSRGIARLRDGVFATFTDFADLPSVQIGAIHVDASGRTWFAPVRAGLYWLDGERARALTIAGLDADVVYSLDGRGDELWVGRQFGGLTHVQWTKSGPTATRYTQKDGLAQDSVFAVHASADGSVWAGTLSGGVSHFTHGTFETYRTTDGLVSNTVTAIAESPDGTMWFGSPQGVTRLSGKRLQPFSAGEGLSGSVTALLVDRRNAVWIGTASGLAVFRDGARPVVEPVTAIRDPVVGLAEDRSGALWCATTDRLVRLSADGDLREYDAADGLISRRAVNRQRTLVVDSRGRVWYATNDGISVADSARVIETGVPAPVRIAAVSADGTVYRATAPVALPSGHRQIVFSFTSVSLAVPERIRYRYRLDPFDTDWSAASSERTARYTNVPPGHYEFQVISADSNGQWTSSTQTLALDVLPAFWQTRSFQAAAVLIVLGGLVAAYRVRVAQVARQLNVRFEERLAERNRIAQELHDTLLQGVLSASMQLHVATSGVPDDAPARSQLSRVAELMGRVIEEGRLAIRGLRAPGTAIDDLEIAFSEASRDLGITDATKLQVTVTGSARSLHPMVRDEVYRIGREAIANAVRHARAKTIDVELDYSADAFVVRVRDDGIGMDDAVVSSGREGHWGLSSMRDRAKALGGVLKIHSRTGAGTEVELSIPRGSAYRFSGRSRARWWTRS
jgi:signal transduction histidine kinase/ligand-binding sensor domain-containing protein